MAKLDLSGPPSKECGARPLEGKEMLDLRPPDQKDEVFDSAHI